MLNFKLDMLVVGVKFIHGHFLKHHGLIQYLCLGVTFVHFVWKQVQNLHRPCLGFTIVHMDGNWFNAYIVFYRQYTALSALNLGTLEGQV